MSTADTQLRNGFILHTRRYTDSRLIIEVFTETDGRQKLVARLPGRSRPNPFLLFRPMLLSWRGSSELKTLINYELVPRQPFLLTGKFSFCGLYINELVQRLTVVADSSPPLFEAYADCISALSFANDLRGVEVSLRQFEFILLRELGFGLGFSHCAESDEPIVSLGQYQLHLDQGFVRWRDASAGNSKTLLGEHLLAIGRGDYSQDATLKAAKSITRRALSQLLGTKPLKSRELFG